MYLRHKGGAFMMGLVFFMRDNMREIASSFCHTRIHTLGRWLLTNQQEASHQE